MRSVIHWCVRSNAEARHIATRSVPVRSADATSKFLTAPPPARYLPCHFILIGGPMHRRLGVVAASLMLLGTVGTGRAADVPIVGTKLIAISKAGRAKVSFIAKDVAVTKGTGTVPDGSLAATLEITYDGVSGGFTMPAPSWRNGDVLAKYTNHAAPTGGSIKLSLIKPGLMLKANARSLGEVPLDIPSAPTGADGLVDAPRELRAEPIGLGAVHDRVRDVDGAG